MMEKRQHFTDFTIEAILEMRPKHDVRHYDKENKKDHAYGDGYMQPSNENSKEKRKSPDVKKTRTVFTRQQLQYLENAFKTKKYFNCMERKKLADFLALSETQVKIWLQNRRNKWKKHATKTEDRVAEMKSAPSLQKFGQ